MIFKRAVYLGVVLFCISQAVFAADMQTINLPSPRTEGGMPLMQAFKNRHSGRDYSSQELPLQVLSDLLWAAGGVNRPETGGRTAPTAMDCREIDIYVVRKDGAYFYDPLKNVLLPVAQGDLRAMTGRQGFVGEAAVNLVFVADFRKMRRLGNEGDFYAATDTGFMSQNVYLFCASEGLETVVRGWVNKTELPRALKLDAQQKIILGQSVGYPKGGER
jgi:SagB-type dehydrogenase family enzyme